MDLLVLMGDPQSVGNALKAIYKYNPSVKVVNIAVANHVLANGNPIRQPGEAAFVPVHVMYVSYESDYPLVGEHGKEFPV